jgi:hypothetical protein
VKDEEGKDKHYGLFEFFVRVLRYLIDGDEFEVFWVG